MITEFPECDATLIELAAQRYGSDTAVPSAAALRHLRGCARCRAALLLLLAQAHAPAAELTAADCARCQGDLAAFIDLESADPPAAARAYPAVWWHLWLCHSCAEIYQITKDLLAGERLAQPPNQAAPALALAPLLLARALVLATLPRRSEPLLAVRGADDRHVLFDALVGADTPRQCTILVDLSDPTAYQLVVVLEPALAGAAELRCGQMCVRGQFDTAGAAVLAPIPAAIFVAPSGPDFEIVFTDR